jgi:hypothetical protein
VNNIVMSSVSIGPEKNGLVLILSMAKPDRGIDAVMSREIWSRLQLVKVISLRLGFRRNFLSVLHPSLNEIIMKVICRITQVTFV